MPGARFQTWVGILSVLLLSSLLGGIASSSAASSGQGLIGNAVAVSRSKEGRRDRLTPRLARKTSHDPGRVSTATAVTSSSPPPPEPGQLFEGSAIGDFWINHSASGAITETSDPGGSGEKVIQMTVKDQDVYPLTPTENPRAELLSPPIITPGREFWLSTKFLVPQNYPQVPADGWVSLVSVYGAPFAGASPWHLEIAGNNLQWQRNETYGYDVPFQTPLEKGRWITVLMHERFSGEGFIEMWVNGAPIDFFSSSRYNPNHVAPTERLAMATMDATNDGNANSAKIMQYRKVGMFESGTIYFGPLRIGRTRASVES
jgi:polysaccharide lyase-like protein